MPSEEPTILSSILYHQHSLRPAETGSKFWGSPNWSAETIVIQILDFFRLQAAQFGGMVAWKWEKR